MTLLITIFQPGALHHRDGIYICGQCDLFRTRILPRIVKPQRRQEERVEFYHLYLRGQRPEDLEQYLGSSEGMVLPFPSDRRLDQDGQTL